MFLEILIFLLLGMFFGILFGLAPGIHPNMIILLVPFFAAMDINPFSLLAFIVAMAIANALSDCIPSIILGAPDSDSAFSVLPGHKLLMKGHGYEAIKLTIIGGLGGILFSVLFLPLILLFVPSVYSSAKPFIWLILLSFVFIMILSEKKKSIAALFFIAAGVIGILSMNLPIDKNFILFPILSGFFGLPLLLLSIKKKTKIPKQVYGKSVEPSMKAISLGSLGGILSGLLPGIGSSEIAGLATTNKKDRSFLMTLGAITTANILLSFLALFLIGNPRSGVAVAVEQLMTIDMNKFLFIVAITVMVSGISVILALRFAKFFLNRVQKINYQKMSLAVLLFMLSLIFYFTGFLGILLAAVCCALGMLINLLDVKRGLLMGILIIPTILFYVGL